MIALGNPKRAVVHGLSAAKAAARKRVQSILARQQYAPLASWSEFEFAHNVKVSRLLFADPITFMGVKDFCDYYIESAEARLEQAVAAPVVETAPVAEAPKSKPLEIGLGEIHLGTQQRKAVTGIVDELFKGGKSNATLLPLGMGTGKTFVYAGVIKYIQDHDYLGWEKDDFTIIIVVPKAVEIKTARALARCGIKDIGSVVQIVTYSGLRSQEFQGFFAKNPDDTVRWRWTKPRLVILDECHNVKNRAAKTTSYIRAWIGPTTKWVHGSATPFEVLDDTFVYTLSAQLQFGGETITDLSFGTAIRAIGECNPRELNAAAAKRFTQWLGPAYVNPPNDPTKIKAFNNVILADFKTPESRARYDAAEDTLVEAWDRLGKVVMGRAAMAAIMMAFQATEEYEKAEVFADLIAESHAKGEAPVVGVKFLATVKAIVGKLAQRGFKRSQISVIQGGEKVIKESDVYDVETFMKINGKVFYDPAVMDTWTPAEKTRYKKSQIYHRTRWKLQETAEEQRERDKWVSGMKLGEQDAVQRQDEIDNFQEGRTEICVFTLAAGGTGLDLDQQTPNVRPRRMFCTICWNGREFVQAFGRCKRKFTLTNVYQSAVFFRNTIVANKIAPRLSAKLACINKVGTSGINLEDDLLSALTEKSLAAEAIDTAPVEDADDVDQTVGDEDTGDDDI